MKKITITKMWRVFVFVIIGLLLFLSVQRMLIPQRVYPLNFENVSLATKEFYMLKDDIDIFFIGNSQMEACVSPMQLYKEYGLVSYNIATSAQPIEGSYYYIKELFESGRHPHLIVIEVGSFFRKEHSLLAWQYILDSAPYNKNKYNLLQNAVRNMNRSKESERTPYQMYIGNVFPIYFYHDKWIELTEANGNNYDYYMQGVFLSPHIGSGSVDIGMVNAVAEKMLNRNDYHKTVYDGREYIEEGGDMESSYDSEIPEANMPYIRDICQICKDNNCDMLFIKCPSNASPGNYTQAWSKYKYENVKALADVLDVPFIDMTYDADIGIDASKDYGDYGLHCNINGAEKVTSFLGSYITSNFHVGAKENSSYDQKLSLYNKYRDAAKIEACTEFDEYIDAISNRDGTRVYMVVHDSVDHIPVSERQKIAKNLGIQNTIESLQNSDTFIAVIENNTIIYESVSNRNQEIHNKIGDDELYMVSSGYLDGFGSSILINNKEYCPQMRGFNLVVEDTESGVIIDSVNIDNDGTNTYITHGPRQGALQYQMFLMKNN